MSELELKMERWRYPRFFTENISDTAAVLDREDSKHVSQVLRMRPGEFAVICDGKGTDYLGRLESAEGECVFEILEKSPNQAEPSCFFMPRSRWCRWHCLCRFCWRR